MNLGFWASASDFINTCRVTLLASSGADINQSRHHNSRVCLNIRKACISTPNDTLGGMERKKDVLRQRTSLAGRKQRFPAPPPL